MTEEKADFNLPAERNFFDTRIQYEKYLVLRAVSAYLWENDFELEAFDFLNFTDKILREIDIKIYEDFPNSLVDRIKIALGYGEKSEIVKVIPSSCNKCQSRGYRVTNACVGCTGRYCKDACKFSAISFDNESHSVIDPAKCKNCSACSKACPYSAIISLKRPCALACNVDAVFGEESEVISLNHDNCISCGACVRKCPFGAISDKSFIKEVIYLLKSSLNCSKYKIYALVAPSFVGQFDYATPGKFVTALKVLGFYEVFEIAIGADMTAYEEAKELIEKFDQKTRIEEKDECLNEKDSSLLPLLTTSCCPSFFLRIQKKFPNLLKNVSHTLTPMAMLGKMLKDKDPECKCIYFGPCISKKCEFQREDVRDYIDAVCTYEELQALLDSKKIRVKDLEESSMESATSHGRNFAKSGGVKNAIVQSLKELGHSEIECEMVVCDGITECNITLLKILKGLDKNTMVEGMACLRGCIGGPGCLRHKVGHKKDLEAYADSSEVESIEDSVESYFS